MLQKSKNGSKNKSDSNRLFIPKNEEQISYARNLLDVFHAVPVRYVHRDTTLYEL